MKTKFLIVFAFCSIFVQAQSFNELKKFANEGNLEAQYRLGLAYNNGSNNAPLDKEEAFYWWKKAAEGGHVSAMERLGLCYSLNKGEHCAQDLQQSLYWYTKAAEKGNAFAQYNLGDIYYRGIGVEIDYQLAKHWCTECATNENIDNRVYARATYLLYEIYTTHFLNKAKAHYWLEKTAAAADISKKKGAADYCTRACNILAEYYSDYHDSPSGKFCAPDLEKAFFYLKKGADLNTLNSNNTAVGMWYLNGHGVQMNCDSAVAYFERGGEYVKLAIMYSGKNNCSIYDVKKTHYYFEKAYEGLKYYSCSSLVTIGRYYMDKDYDKAYKAFEQANKTYIDTLRFMDMRDSDEGYKCISWCYITGKGTAQNLSEAKTLLDKYIALHPNDTEAFLFLGNYYMAKNQKDSAAMALKTVLSQVPEAEIQDEPLYRYVYNIKGNSKGERNVVLAIESGVDKDIPQTSVVNDKTFVVILANENYNEVENVPYAMKDGTVFSTYCEKTLGIPSRNIHIVTDATLNQMKREVSWISQTLQAYNGEAKAIIYYAGHGIPDEANKDAYLLPVDGYGNDATTGYKVSTLYQTLGSLPARQITIFMDACFSGTKRDGGMLASARGVAIKAKPSSPQGNMVVFSAAQGDETAYPNNEEGHGMFTYFLLKKLQESGGDVDMQTLGDYLVKNVSQQSIVINGKSQTPTVNSSAILGDSWKNWKLK